MWHLKKDILNKMRIFTSKLNELLKYEQILAPFKYLRLLWRIIEVIVLWWFERVTITRDYSRGFKTNRNRD